MSISPDYERLTKDLVTAAEQGDAERQTMLYCPNAVLLRPDGAPLTAEFLIDVARRRKQRLEPATTQRDWETLHIFAVANATIVSGTSIVKGTHGDLKQIVTVVWVDEPAGPRAILFQRAAGGDAAIAAQWDAAYVSSTEINRSPNNYLMRSVSGMPAGAALDVCMGEGRNSVGLAQAGWEVTGFDISRKGIALAQEQAKAMDLKIDAINSSAEDFDFGIDRWDLIIFMYAPIRNLERKAFESLKTGGIVVVESFADTGMSDAINDLAFQAGELKNSFENTGFQIIEYEEETRLSDWGRAEMKLVRVTARKV